MRYIIMDMEWNQASVHEKMVTDPVPLIGEVVRIGAVATCDGQNEADRFSVCIRARFYRRINRKVKQVTGLGNESITYGISFPAAWGRFRKWCGEDCCILTWGTEDEKVLRANLAVYGLPDDDLPPFYDMQMIFARTEMHDSRQYSVSTAVEHYGLPLDLPVHDALNDAVLTFRIGTKLYLPNVIPDGYGELLRQIAAEQEEQQRKRCLVTFRGIVLENTDDVYRIRKIMHVRCPVCRKGMRHPKFEYVSERKSVTYAACEEHGQYIVMLKLSRCADGTYDVTRRIEAISDSRRDSYEQRVRAFAEECADDGELCVERITAPDDIDAALRLVRRTFEECTAPMFDPHGRESFRAFIFSGDIESGVENGTVRAYAARRSRHMVSAMFTRDETHIILAFTDKEYQRQGCGKALLEAVARDIEGREELTVNAAPSGYAFYEKSGFVPAGEERTEDGITFTPMKKILVCTGE
ncbi:MAG: GNAT family N-acetyltransferase [Oscillospiraceae bacterium]|nr:GNAT family N-acetyltransferase [Oscillospiraceae bacterium]